MNKKETAILLKQLSVLFPNQFQFPKHDEEQDQITISVWHDKLGEFDGQLVAKAVDEIGESNPDFAPTPFRVRKKARKFKDERRRKQVEQDMLEQIESKENPQLPEG